LQLRKTNLENIFAFKITIKYFTNYISLNNTWLQANLSQSASIVSSMELTWKI
jgi:hypothetical protein